MHSSTERSQGWCWSNSFAPIWFSVTNAFQICLQPTLRPQADRLWTDKEWWIDTSGISLKGCSGHYGAENQVILALILSFNVHISIDRSKLLAKPNSLYSRLLIMTSVSFQCVCRSWAKLYCIGAKHFQRFILYTLSFSARVGALCILWQPAKVTPAITRTTSCLF